MSDRGGQLARGAVNHVVQFYGADDELADNVGRYLADGIRSGEGVVVVATAPHRLAFEAAASELIGRAAPGTAGPVREVCQVMSGHGLSAVAQLASRWAVDPPPGGKVVWAELPVPGLPGAESPEPPPARAARAAAARELRHRDERFR